MITKREVQREIDDVNDLLESLDSKLRFSCKNDDAERDTLNLKVGLVINMIVNSDTRRNKFRFTQLRHTSDKLHCLQVIKELIHALNFEKTFKEIKK